MLRYSEYTKLLTDYVVDLNRDKDYNNQKLNELGLLRDYSVKLLNNLGIVYVGDSVNLMHPKYMNYINDFGLVANKKLIYSNRYIIPIKDIYGKVVGLVGYNSNSKRRYMYATGMYYNRRNTFYGLQNIDTITRDGYAIIVEGITDAIALYNIGYRNVLANCGTHKNRLGEDITSRLKYGVLVIPDTDMAGMRAYKLWQFNKNRVKLELSGHKDIASYLFNASSSRVDKVRDTINLGVDRLKYNSKLGIANEVILGI